MGILIAIVLGLSVGSFKADSQVDQSTKFETNKSGGQSISWDWVNEG